MRKKLAFILLITLTFLILIAGIFFSVFSLSNHIVFEISGRKVPGLVFGSAAMLLGTKHAISLGRKMGKINAKDNLFFWENMYRNSGNR